MKAPKNVDEVPQYTGFWKGKQPCWVVVGCSPIVYRDCPAYQNTARPCWELKQTQCEKVFGLPRNCPQCTVYDRYHAA